jgi:outer membrane protein
MKLNASKLIIIILISLLVLTIVYFNKSTSRSTKQVFIISNALFQSFDGTKALKKKVDTKGSYYKSVLDSLKLELSLNDSGTNSKPTNKQQALEQSYRSYYNQMMEYNNEYITAEETKIWTQLNQYITEYGKTKDYEYILGANGSGSLMYADSTLNITEEVTAFANKKYSGK